MSSGQPQMPFAPKQVQRNRQLKQQPQRVQPQPKSDQPQRPMQTGLYKQKKTLQFDMKYYNQNTNEPDISVQVPEVHQLDPQNGQFEPGGPINLQCDHITASQPFQLVQFPQMLPFRTLSRVQGDNSALYLQEGRIGTLVRYKSGRQKFIMNNDIAFEVFKGQPNHTITQLVSVDREKNIIQHIGHLGSKLVCALSFTELGAGYSSSGVLQPSDANAQTAQTQEPPHPQ